uniref:Complex I assembly factor TIMMDC1, mitochondrial n=2 Tax=Oryza meridionalis TaxID=40149 RepID=A0A0E0C0J7_9ORYZ
MAASAPPPAEPPRAAAAAAANPPASTAPTEDGEVEAGATPPRTSALGTANWGTATLVGVFAGLLYGGSKEASASVSKDAEVMLKMGSTTDKREQYRLMRDAMEKRFIRVAKGSLVGGVRLGMFTATFFGIQNLLIEKRGVHDIFNIAGAGSATAAAFGLILPGSPMWRARNVLVGSALGAGVCFPLGWIQLKLAEKANLEMASSKPADLVEEQGNQSGVGAAIERLGRSLKKSTLEK